MRKKIKINRKEDRAYRLIKRGAWLANGARIAAREGQYAYMVKSLTELKDVLSRAEKALQGEEMILKGENSKNKKGEVTL